MVLGSEVESEVSAVRFGHYIDELQEFFAGRGVRFGSPGDLSRLAERLSGPSFFHDEMASMVRAIIYRESEGVRREDLLDLVAVAAGGPYVDLTAPELRPAVQQLLSFFSDVLRSLWKRFPGEIEAEPEPLASSGPVPPEPAMPAPVARHNAAIEPAPVSLVAPIVANPAVEPDPEDDAAREIAARARAALDRAAAAGQSTETAQVARQPAPAPPAESPALPVPVRRRNAPFWAIGCCGVLLGLSAGLFFRYHPPLLDLPGLKLASQQQPDRSNPTAAPAPADLPIRDTSVPPASRISPRHIQPRGNVPPVRIHPPKPLADTGAPASPYRPQPAPAAPAPRTAAPVPQPLSQVLGLSQSPAVTPPASRSRPGQSYAAADPRQLRSGMGQSEPLVRVAPAFSETRPSVFLASSGVMAANLLFAPAPQYPSEALAAGTEGRVVLQALVWRDGTVAAMHIIRGDRILGAAAEEAVRHWRYRPFVVNGRPGDVATSITVDFHIHR